MRRLGGATKPRPGDASGVEGALTLTDELGEPLHTIPGEVAESLRYLVARARATGTGDLPQLLGITSAISGEGVTFMSRSLALVVAHDAGRSVCLVDLNWWSPHTWPTGDPNQPGVADVLRGSIDLGYALLPTDHPTLDLLPAGATTPIERAALANSTAVKEMFGWLCEYYEHVFVDLPAIHETSEALTLAKACGSVALVIGQGVTPSTQVRDAVAELEGIDLIGVALNRASSKVPGFLRRRIPGT